MSGFAAVFHLDGAPVDRAWLEILSTFLAFRGPDGKAIWISGNVGMCHTLLRTSAETDGREQIPNLDGSLWLCGDVRVDDRETLIAKLPRGPFDLETASSADLILHSYARWGEACVEHLLGDFSFVIWDARQRRVFAARDQLGVKPFFYARLGQSLLVSNTLDCIRKIPGVPAELNEQAVGDHLIAGGNFNPATTFFSAIQRLPAAHRLIARLDGFLTERYWTLPIQEPIYYKAKHDYVDRFHELLRAAVRDRLPDGPLGIFMSGGLDSPAVAATAVHLGAGVTAFTSVYDWLIPDEERYYAGLVAQHLGIPIHYEVRDDETFGWDPSSAPIHTPEPSVNPASLLRDQQHFAEVAAHTRVVFSGIGPDGALWYEWRPYLAHLVGKRSLNRLCKDVAFHFVAHRRIPLLPTLLKKMWRERRSNRPNWFEPSFPLWINQEFSTRLGLMERWIEINTPLMSPHSIRPQGYNCFVCDFPMGGGWGNEGVHLGALEELHPFADLRLVQFLMDVPAVPWCREKYLIRAAMRELLPHVICRRPKAPLAGFPELERARRCSLPELPPFPQLERYLDTARVPKWPGRDREELYHHLWVLGLHYWLLSLII